MVKMEVAVRFLQQKNNLESGQMEHLLRMAAEKLGTDPQTLEAKLRQGGVPGGPGMERLQQIMGDPQAVQSLLRSPQAQALLKSLKKQQK